MPRVSLCAASAAADVNKRQGIGYPNFFLATALMGVPVLVLIVYIGRQQPFLFKLRSDD